MVGQREFMDVHDAWVRGKSISEIARATGRDRKTIRRLLREGTAAPRKPRQISSKLDPFREYLLARMVGEDPVSNAEVLYDEIRELGYQGGRSILKEFMHPFRALAKEKATVRFETSPGRQAHVDWGTFKKPGRKRVQGFVMTLGWSRAQYLDFTDSQALALFLACHEQAFHDFGGVPEEILYDRVKTVWLRDDDHGDPVLHASGPNELRLSRCGRDFAPDGQDREDDEGDRADREDRDTGAYGRLRDAEAREQEADRDHEQGVDAKPALRSREARRQRTEISRGDGPDRQVTRSQDVQPQDGAEQRDQAADDEGDAHDP